MSLLQPRSNVLAVWGLDPGYSEQQCNSPSEEHFRNCWSSRSFFPFPSLFLTCAGSEAGATAPQCRWQGMELCLLQCWWVQVTKPLLAQAALAGKQTLLQSCAMLPDDSLHSLFIPLGTQKGAKEQISTLQTQFPPCISLPFQVSLCPYLRGVQKTCQNNHQ